MFRKLAAECFGTFWLVFGGCGSAVLAAGFPELGIGFAGVALAFGLTVLTMAFAVGHISGGHFNPAVTIGLWAGGRFPAKEVVGYVIAQVVGGIVAADMRNDGQLAFGFAHHCLQHGLALVHMLVDALTGGTADIHALNALGDQVAGEGLDTLSGNIALCVVAGVESGDNALVLSDIFHGLSP